MAILPSPQPIRRQAPTLGALLTALSRFGEERRRSELNAFAQLGQGLGQIGEDIGRGLERRHRLQSQRQLQQRAHDAALARQNAASDAAMERALLNNEAAMDRARVAADARVRAAQDRVARSESEKAERLRREQLSRLNSVKASGLAGPRQVRYIQSRINEGALLDDMVIPDEEELARVESSDIARRLDPMRGVPSGGDRPVLSEPTRASSSEGAPLIRREASGPTRLATPSVPPPPAGLRPLPAFGAQMALRRVLSDPASLESGSSSRTPAGSFYNLIARDADRGLGREELIRNALSRFDDAKFRGDLISGLGDRFTRVVPDHLTPFRVRAPGPGGRPRDAENVGVYDPSVGRRLTEKEMSAKGIAAARFDRGGDLRSAGRSPRLSFLGSNRVRPKGEARAIIVLDDASALKAMPEFRPEVIGLFVDEVLRRKAARSPLSGAAGSGALFGFDVVPSSGAGGGAGGPVGASGFGGVPGALPFSPSGSVPPNGDVFRGAGLRVR